MSGACSLGLQLAKRLNVMDRLMVRAAVLAGVLTTLSGCMASMTSMGTKQVPLVHSSLDMNKGKPQTTSVVGTDLGATVAKLTELGEKRSLVLVKKECTDTGCDVVYKRIEDSKSKTVGSSSVTGSGDNVRGSGSTNTYNLSFSSRIFGSLKLDGDKINVEMVGVPTINDTPSCPPLLEQRQACEPQPFNVMGDNTPASSFKAQWGVDISGKLEAEIISGIFAELS